MIYGQAVPHPLIFSASWGITKLSHNVLLADKYALSDLQLINANKIDLIICTEEPL